MASFLVVLFLRDSVFNLIAGWIIFWFVLYSSKLVVGLLGLIIVNLLITIILLFGVKCLKDSWCT